MRVFISSVMSPRKSGNQIYYEMAGDREAAIQAIESMGFDPVAFERLPPVHTPAKDTYRQKLADSDIAVFLLWQRITDAVIDEYNEATRLGIPRLVLVKECYEGESRTPELESFLSDTVGPEDTGVTYGRFRTTQELQELIRSSIVHYITHSLRSSTFKAPISRNLYAEAAVIAGCSRERLALCQHSLSYIFPVKLTDDPDRNRAEHRLYEAIDQWVKRVRNNTPCRLLLLGAMDKSISEFQHLSEDNRIYVLQRLKEFEKLENEFPQHVRLGWVDSYKKDMYVASAGERRYGLYISNPLTGDPVALLVGSNRELSDAIFSYVEKTILTSKITTRDIIGALEAIDRNIRMNK